MYNNFWKICIKKNDVAFPSKDLQKHLTKLILIIASIQLRGDQEYYYPVMFPQNIDRVMMYSDLSTLDPIIVFVIYSKMNRSSSKIANKLVIQPSELQFQQFPSNHI